jgi:hypothetical protein
MWFRNRVFGDGGMYSTVLDLLAWHRFLYDDDANPLSELMHSKGSLANGEPLDYAFGIEHGRFRGLPTVGHGELFGGYRAHLIRLPEQVLSIAVLCNRGDLSAQTLAAAVAEIFPGSHIETRVVDGRLAVVSTGALGARLPSPVALMPTAKDTFWSSVRSGRFTSKTAPTSSRSTTGYRCR